mgnify:CR=1 FL=1
MIIGISCTQQICMDPVMSFLGAERSGGGSAALQSMRQLGRSVGVASFGTILTTSYRSHLHLDRLPDELVAAVANSPSLGVVTACELRSLIPTLFDQIMNGFVVRFRQAIWGMRALAGLTTIVTALKAPCNPDLWHGGVRR